MNARNLFTSSKPVIGCIHLLPLPGSPGYDGNMQRITDVALQEASIYLDNGLHGVIVENFGDLPFYPDHLPPETISAMAVITLEIRKAFSKPIGVNALRNDAAAALAIALATNAEFIRVNVHTGAAITDQGIIQGKAYETLRLRKNLNAKTLIFADVHVKHAKPLVEKETSLEVQDIEKRGKADALIISGQYTGGETDAGSALKVKQITDLPVFIGSGTNPENLVTLFPVSDGFIVGSYFKTDGQAENRVDPDRVRKFMDLHDKLEAHPSK